MILLKTSRFNALSGVMYSAFIFPGFLDLARRANIGITAVSVLPEPVGAITSESIFWKIIGTAFFWMYVRFSKPRERNLASSSDSSSGFFILSCSSSLVDHYPKKSYSKKNYSYDWNRVKNICHEFVTVYSDK